MLIEPLVLRCDCGSLDVFATKPGSEPITAPGPVLVDRGEPMQCWCRGCYPLLQREAANG